MRRVDAVAQPAGLGGVLVVEALQGDVHVDQRRRELTQDVCDRLVSLDLGLGVSAVPLADPGQRQRQTAPVAVLAHDVPRAPHDQRLNAREHRQPPPGLAGGVVAKVTDHGRALTVAALQGQETGIGKGRLHVAQNLFQGGILAGIVILVLVVAVGVLPGDGGLQGCHLGRPVVLHHMPSGRGGVVGGSFGDPLAPDRDPEFNVAYIGG